MTGAFVTIKTSSEKTTVSCTYNGKLSLKPKEFHVTPGFEHVHAH